MKISKFTIIDNETVLISEEITDENSNIIQSIDYSTEPHVEKRFSYNEKGFMIEESELSEGEELSKNCLQYDEKGHCTENLLYISGELYEKVITEYNGSSYTRTIFQDGEETEKMVREVNGKNYINRFYQNREITETQESKYDADSNSSEIKIFDADNNLISFQKESYDSSNFVTKSQDFTPSGHLVSESYYENEGEFLTREIQRNFYQGGTEVVVTYEYDSNKNLVKKEARNPAGTLIMFHHMNYDNNNRLLEEAYVASSEPGAIYGGGFRGDSFHYIYKYEEL